MEKSRRRRPYAGAVLECVINVSEGRDMGKLRALADACGASLIDVHADADHHRSVFTLAGPGARDACDGARALAGAVAEHLTIVDHSGEHPRFGALDVVPFVALGGTNAERASAAEAARAFASWLGTTLDVPVFLYDDADPEQRDLPHARTHGFKSRKPDYGPAAPHPTLGATAVGARRPLIAINCVLVARDVMIARKIARAMRERDGGMRGVRALGFFLPDIGRAQVSMNLTDIDRTGVQDACLHVRELAQEAGSDVGNVELVGLLPRRELDRCSDDFLKWSRIDATSTIEARIGNGPRWWPGDPLPAGV
jgi:glutamate formiminotransferase / 5-formyltetrahydrofolate cyclo-ligase